MLFSKGSAFLCPLFLMVDLNSVPNRDVLILTKIFSMTDQHYSKPFNIFLSQRTHHVGPIFYQKIVSLSVKFHFVLWLTERKYALNTTNIVEDFV